MAKVELALPLKRYIDSSWARICKPEAIAFERVLFLPPISTRCDIYSPLCRRSRSGMLKSSKTLLLILIRMVFVMSPAYKSVFKETLALCSHLVSNVGAKNLIAGNSRYR
jgi:hypothetical protein